MTIIQTIKKDPDKNILIKNLKNSTKYPFSETIYYTINKKYQKWPISYTIILLKPLQTILWIRNKSDYKYEICLHKAIKIIFKLCNIKVGKA